ncbi:MAG: hypothetical protein PHP95_15725 [Desulfuromonadaceae bacterium]|nr:hypothetical protein [Desulfuromonadaceae bacterium]MDD2849901.1 hypothetical protein [Desulfuromonadaceae bacterium]MDD4131741.1 hypothetical protein [Desulfuromonadaceae bacterium]
MKTKQQLRRSAMNSFWTALMIATLPMLYFLDYRKFGFIYSGKPPIIITTGTDSLIIMYGTLLVAVIAVLYASYNIVCCLIKIKRGEYSKEDESPEFVICKNCQMPQFSRDLIEGRCAKCNGIVVNLEGYYDNPSISQKESTLVFAIISILKMIVITTLVIATPFLILYVISRI